MEPDDLERAIFFERARDEAEQAVEKDSNDASALTRWGGALLELAHFRQGHDAFDMIDQVSFHLSSTKLPRSCGPSNLELSYRFSSFKLELMRCESVYACCISAIFLL